MLQENLVFIKLGGSLITDKSRPYIAHQELIKRLASELAQMRRFRPELQILLGHGSGSFGHQAAVKYDTRSGVNSKQEWQGFAEVWYAASSLNRLVMTALHEAGLPAIAFPASAAALAADGDADNWEIQPIKNALAASLLPVIYGDVVFDRQRGGTILSTEALFAYLAVRLKPALILLAGQQAGVWADYPRCTRLVREITPANFGEVSQNIQGSEAVDVTGGMLTKVRESLQLIEQVPGMEIQIFSALEPGQLQRALESEPPGTRLFIDSPSDLN